MATPSLYSYESGVNDLTRKYGQDQAVNDYARFISQRRSKRGLDDAQRTFQRSIPGFMGQTGARRGINSDVRSGMFAEGVGNFAGDYARNYNRALEDEAGTMAGVDLQRSQGQADYEAQLRALYERLQQERGAVDPVAALRGLVA